MSVRIWTGSGSPYSWRVLLALRFKGIPYEEQVLSFSARDHKAPDYLARNPRGKVPTLECEGAVFYESLGILAFLEARFPDPPLLGRNPVETGRIWQRLAEIDNYLAPVMHAFFRPIFFGNPAGQEHAIQQAAGVIHLELGGYEALLDAAPWITGDAPSAADLALYPMLRSILRAAARPSVADLDLALLPIAESYPRVAAWMGRVEALPGFAATVPPHWQAADDG